MNRIVALLFYILLLPTLSSSILSQNKHKVDSLLAVLDTTSRIDNMVKSYIGLYNIYSDINIDKSKEYISKLDSLLERTDEPIIKAKIYDCKGRYHFKLGNLEKARDYFTQAHNIFKTENDSSKIASTANNLGNAYEQMGQNEKALTYLLEALRIGKEQKNKMFLGKVYLNVGLIHFKNKNYQTSREYYNKSLELRKEIKDSAGIALVYNNMAILNYYLENYDEVRAYFRNAYNIYKELGNLRRQALTLSNLGEINYYLGQSEKALSYFQECARIEKNLNDKIGLSGTYQMMSSVYKGRGNYNTAIHYLDKAFNHAREANANEEIKDIFFAYHEIYKTKEDYKKSLDYFEKYHTLNDSLYNVQRAKEINELQTKYETEKKEKQISLLNKEKKLQNVKIQKQRNFTILLAIIIGIILISTVLIYLQKRKIKEAHFKLSKQQKQITDSIEYASRIQNAILPKDENIKNLISQDYFILFKPREMVSGDFYFIEKKNNKTIIAAVDCTGHGVPGAFMSMLGYSFLTEIINHMEDPQPHLILNKLKQYVINALHQKNEIGIAKDGMDISLCVIDHDKEEIQFSGAYHQLLVINDGKITRYKGDKMPVGIHYKKMGSFRKKTIPFQKNQKIYMFSDGFQDQFGGANGKKFRIKQLEETLLDINKEPMEIQKIKLDKTFSEWKANYEQVDDVLVIGINL
jgi:tetratricopeptide (TPR) repeat protein